MKPNRLICAFWLLSAWLVGSRGLGQNGPGKAKPSLAPAAREITGMEDEELSLAYPKKRATLEFAGGRFSPDGAFLAIALTGITSGDIDQVWLYDLRTRHLRHITQDAQPPYLDFRIYDLAWSGETLYVKIGRVVDGGSEERFFLAATTNQVVESMGVPTDVKAEFDSRIRSDCLRGFSCWSAGDSRYKIETESMGHGTFTLFWRETNRTEQHQLTISGWEIAHFLYDADRSEVTYLSDAAIVTFDLPSRKNVFVRSLENPNAGLWLIDQAADGLIAFTVAGPCSGTIDPQQLRTASWHVCFVQGR